MQTSEGKRDCRVANRGSDHGLGGFGCHLSKARVAPDDLLAISALCCPRYVFPTQAEVQLPLRTSAHSHDSHGAEGRARDWDESILSTHATAPISHGSNSHSVPP